jgi:hypothetical protein
VGRGIKDFLKVENNNHEKNNPSYKISFQRRKEAERFSLFFSQQ